MTKHTQGPWHVVIEDGKPGVKSLDDFYITNTIDAAGYESDNDTMFANARLIAAAPELLEALEGVFHACLLANEDESIPFELDGDLLDAARAAIAKATGEKA